MRRWTLWPGGTPVSVGPRSRLTVNTADAAVGAAVALERRGIGDVVGRARIGAERVVALEIARCRVAAPPDQVADGIARGWLAEGGGASALVTLCVGVGQGVALELLAV